MASQHRDRGGTALFVVLVVLVLLTLAAYVFMTSMIAERQATKMYAREVQTRLLAESGIEYAAAMLENPDELIDQNYYHDPTYFSGVTIVSGSDTRNTGQFSLVAPVERDASATQFRYGLMDESGKLNINAIESFGLDEYYSRELLMYIPNMTEYLADSILDWVDDDDVAREFGAEVADYESFASPYEPTNGPAGSLDELLKVDGMTYELLYGEDANRNGLLDPNENDGETQLPYDNADGILDLGFSAYLTVYGKESNLRADGSDKIDINQSLLTELYDQIIDEGFPDEVAQFIVAYRMNGANNIEQLDGQLGVSTGDAQTDNALQNIAQSIVRNVASGNNDENSVTRGGMDLSEGGAVKFISLYDLVDAEVTAQIDGTSVTLTSPWTSSSTLDEEFPALFDTFTVTNASTIRGRISINSCRAEVLMGIPEFPLDLATAIAESQFIGTDGEPLPEEIARRSTTAWLLVDGLVDQTTLRLIDPFITAKGSVYRVQSIGHYGEGGPATRLEAILDSTQSPAKVLSLRDLSGLGTGYPVTNSGAASQ
ncbi:MAG: general secretion pathway protein GspK [Planctomycetaceae bacterium]|nr:general secretion pathway protein GspK [Planctomycetaceae bacterium]